MFFTLLPLHRPGGSQRPGPGRARRRPASQRLAAAPRLQVLEGRALLSTTFTVTNLANSGDGSLRQAILDANANPGADVIRFAPKLHLPFRVFKGCLSRIYD